MSSKINLSPRKKNKTANKWLGIVFMVLFGGVSRQNINYCLFVTNRMARNEGCKREKIQTCLWSIFSISIETCYVKICFQKFGLGFLGALIFISVKK